MAANKKAIETFPEAMFLPGFWSEYGMCSEPSAFGAKQIWSEYNLPHADKVIHQIEDIQHLKKPNPATDGMLPFIIQRLVTIQPQIQEMGHEIKFAIARGPLNIATFLMGTTEFMMALMMNPAVLKVVLQLLAATQATPSGQHWRALLATVCSPDSVTVTAAPLLAAG